MPTSNIGSQSPPGQVKKGTSQHRPVQAQTPEMTPAQRQKASLNAAIVESAQVSIGAKDESLALLLKTAIDKINEALTPELGELAIQEAVDSGLDVSPEATAERIVSLSTGFYGAFKEQNPNDDESASLNKFLDTIGSGIDKGFEQARDILESLKVLEGDVANNINETYDIVQDKLSAFKAMVLELDVEK